MFSSWGNSWGSAWGNAWGKIKIHYCKIVGTFTPLAIDSLINEQLIAHDFSLKTVDFLFTYAQIDSASFGKNIQFDYSSFQINNSFLPFSINLLSNESLINYSFTQKTINSLFTLANILPEYNTWQVSSKHCV